MTEPEQSVMRAIEHWVETLVIGENLCPFARKEWVGNRVRLTVSAAESVEDLLVDLDTEIRGLDADETIETTLLIHPNVLGDFLDYNDFLDLADGLIEQRDRLGVYQLASFHPQYRFAGTEPDAAENYTNRAPYPVLHLLREASLEAAIERYPDTEAIPDNNIRRMDALGAQSLAALLKACYSPPPR